MIKNKSQIIENTWYNVKKISIAIIIGAIISGVFIYMIGVNPIEAYGFLIKGIFTRRYGVGEMLVKATPLIFIALGFSISFKAGLTNLGGDGQLIIGALFAILAGTSISGIPVFFHLLLIGSVAMIAGGIWGGIAGFFKAKFNTNEVIMTIMMNYVAAYLVSFLIERPLRDKSAVLPQSEMVPAHLELAKVLEGTRAHIGIIIAIIFAVLVYIFIKKTDFGYRIRAIGFSPPAARYAGINISRQIILSMGLSGALAGLAGMTLVYGTTFRVLDGMAGGMGFTAIVVAILGRTNPFGIILAALLIGGLSAGGNSMQVQIGVPAAIIQILQGLIIFFIVIGYSDKKSIIRKFLGVKRGCKYE